MTDLDKWLKEQRDWGFDPQYERYGNIIKAIIRPNSSDNFFGFDDYFLEVIFTAEGEFLRAGVWS